MNIGGKNYKRIVFVHCRTGERDGVSLEIEKRAEILIKKRHQVYFISGFDPRKINGKDKNFIEILPEIDIKQKISSVLRENFLKNKIFNKKLSYLIFQLEEKKIYKKFSRLLEKIKPDLIFIHNLFSLPYHLPATSAILKVLDQKTIPVVAVHHDLWWERDLFLKPKFSFIKTIINQLPPKRKYIIKHQTINKLAQQNIFKIRKIKAEKITDYFDFNLPLPSIDNFNQDFRQRFKIKKNDLIILHATRITERKAIENAIFFTLFFEKEIKKINPYINVHLFLPNFVETDSMLYFKKLRFLAEELKISLIFSADSFALDRKILNGLKIYSFWDAYQMADLITYTSYLEGWGNQLLEAFWAKKIPVVFEYPVFKKEIINEGYQYISLGDKMIKKDGFYLVPQKKIKQAAEEAVKIYFNQKLKQKIVEKNYQIAKKFHHIDILEKQLENILQKI